MAVRKFPLQFEQEFCLDFYVLFINMKVKSKQITKNGLGAFDALKPLFLSFSWKRPDKPIAKYIIYSISHTQEKVQLLFEQLGIAY